MIFELVLVYIYSQIFDNSWFIYRTQFIYKSDITLECLNVLTCIILWLILIVHVMN